MHTEVRQSRPTRPTRKTPHLALRALRINKGWSRDDLARVSAVSRETIRLAEAGFLPTPRVQFAIATAFEMTPLDLWPIERQVQR
jgi:transcriptional regulator with XRE-family HTH domain